MPEPHTLSEVLRIVADLLGEITDNLDVEVRAPDASGWSINLYGEDDSTAATVALLKARGATYDAPEEPSWPASWTLYVRGIRITCDEPETERAARCDKLEADAIQAERVRRGDGLGSG